jgi:hypothetical protein
MRSAGLRTVVPLFAGAARWCLRSGAVDCRFGRAGEQRGRRRCHVQDSQHARSGGGARHERGAPGMFEESNAL